MTRSGFATVSGQQIYEEIKKLTDEISNLDKDIQTLETDGFPPDPFEKSGTGISILKSKRQEKQSKLEGLRRMRYIPEQTYLQEKEDDDA